MQKPIIEFLQNNKIAGICFLDKENNPYCINCFYFFDDENGILVFKSSYGTTHDSLVLTDAKVAGTILPDSLDPLKIKGIQFTGLILDKLLPDTFKLSSQYTKKYPLSLTMPGYIWAVKLETIKYTNNTLGFGNKTLWKRGEETI